MLLQICGALRSAIRTVHQFKGQGSILNRADVAYATNPLWKNFRGARNGDLSGPFYRPPATCVVLGSGCESLYRVPPLRGDCVHMLASCGNWQSAIATMGNWNALLLTNLDPAGTIRLVVGVTQKASTPSHTGTG